MTEVKAIADANRDALGFLPKMKFQEAIEQERCFVAVEGADILGFVVFRHRKIDLQTTLSDICVDAEKRRQGVGRSLIEKLTYDCEDKDRAFIQLKCPQNLKANQFYQNMGFELATVEEGKSRKLNVWRMPISEKIAK